MHITIQQHSSYSSESTQSVAAALLDQGHHVTLNAEIPNELPEDTLLILHPESSHAHPCQYQTQTLDSGAIQNAIEAQQVTKSSQGKPNFSSAAENLQGKPNFWKPWFPVIDYSRCTNCMQCLSFCLFDVYGVSDDQEIQVQNQDNCKTNCPACSRVCPEVAIMFPKYKAGPINGEPVKAEDLEREKMKVDISSLLGGDIYASLRTRSEKAKSRFSKERDEDKALAERKKCLVKLQQDGFIPAEALEHLPSPEEIQRKAQEAQAKAAAALEAQKS